MGNLPRNSFRGPRYFNVDLSLIKNVRVPWMTGSPANVQLRVEAFNVLNTTNLVNPVNNVTSAQFGRSVEALPGRIVQFSGRLSF